MQARYILQIADIHIGSGNRSVEYRSVFDKLFIQAKQFSANELIIVICGDIFHHKVKYSGDDVADFNYLMDGLQDYQVIIIPGNHDANLNDIARTDLLSPLIGSTNIHYWKNSGFYELSGIKFYHISVYDNSTQTQLESFVALEHDFSDIIILYHGMINGAKFGTHTVKDSRISKLIIDKARAVIAGDIHQHQFITPTAAYSGSLIQQNLSEGPDKGVILWDLITMEAKFIRVVSDHGFVRLDLRGKSAIDCERLINDCAAPKTLLKVSVITDAADEICDKQIAQVKERLGQVDRINRVTNNSPIDVVSDITETLAEMLITAGATEEQMEEIVTTHAQKISTFDCKKWYVESMKWDNMFKYGVGNIIDFTKLSGGVSGVIASNRAGKSSIIDILVFGLFNTHLRGDKKSMIHHGAKYASIRVDFVVNGIKYYVERRDDSIKHSKILLCKLVDEKWVNITETAIDITYRKIRQMIGTVDQFLATGLYYDSINDIIKMSKTDRMKLLSELFGLIDNEAILREIKARMKITKNKIDALVKPRMTNSQEELDNKNKELNNIKLSREELITANNQLEQKIADLTMRLSTRKRDDVLHELNLTKSASSSTILELDKIHVEVEVKYADPITIPANELLLLKKQAVVVCEPSTDIATKIAILSANIPAELPSDSVFAKKQQLEKIINITQDKLNNLLAQMVEVRDARIISQELKDISLKIPKLIPIDMKYINSIISRIDKLREGSQLKFDANCTDCCNNKSILAADLAAAETELSLANEELLKKINSNKSAQELIDKYSKLKIKLNEEMLLSLNQSELLTRINKIELELETLHAELEIVVKQSNLLTNYTQSLDKLKTLKISLDLAKKTESAKQKLHKLYMFEQWNLCKKRDKLIEDSAKYVNKIRLLTEELQIIDEQFIDSALLHKYINDRKSNISDISAKDKLIGQLEAIIDQLIKEVKINNDYNNLLPPLNYEFTKLKLYANCVGSPTLRFSLINKNISRIINSANEILAAVTDFSIKNVSTDDSIELFLVEKDRTIPVALGSGFQKFVVSIALRLALTSLLPAAPEFIIIDEGFGCMDSQNISRAAELFAGISSLYKFVFLISHIDELNNTINIPLFIVNRSNPAITSHAYINNTPDVTNAITADSELLDSSARSLRAEWLEAATAAPVVVPEQKEVVVVVAPDEIRCVCGALVKKRSLAMHVKSAKHKKIVG